MQLLLIADKDDETSRQIVGFFSDSNYQVIEAASVDVVLRNILKKKAMMVFTILIKNVHVLSMIFCVAEIV